MKAYVFLIVLALVGGGLGHYSGIPVGALLGSLLFVALFQMKTKKLPSIPLKIKRAIQIVLGANIGLSLTSETIAVFKEIWLLALVIPIIQLTIAVLLGLLLIRMLKIDAATAFCSSVPAGISEISVLAEKYQANIPLVITVHICRVFFLVFTIPFIVYLLL